MTEVETGANILTHSRMSCARKCPKMHYYAYVLGVKPARQARPLYLGSAIHMGRDELAKGYDIEQAIETVLAECKTTEPVGDEELHTKWQVDNEIIANLLRGYAWRWSEMPMKFIASEFQFNMPIVNPATGRTSRTFTAAGKIDGIVDLGGRLAENELKTCSEDLSADSIYWSRLRIDQQISLYFIGAQSAGYNVETILYDVIRKPSIRLKQKETPAEYGERLLADIGDRPDFYLARKEIPRLESDLDEFRWELWDTAKLLSDCERYGRWPRNTGACVMFGQCPYLDLCLHGWKDGDELPEKYMRVENIHQELLKETENGNDNSTA